VNWFKRLVIRSDGNFLGSLKSFLGFECKLVEVHFIDLHGEQSQRYDDTAPTVA
jgi:hypothetical protein